jgi:hypothetical protein
MRNKPIIINTMKQKKLALIVLLISLHSILISGNFQPGFIINRSGARIDGSVDYKHWERNPDVIMFKDHGNSVHEYAPPDILGFGVAGTVFESALVEIEVSARTTGQLTDNPKLNIELKNVFLQALILGEKSLYLFRDQFDNDHFYLMQGQEYELLVYKKYFVNHQGSRVISENNKYRGQLTVYLDACRSIQDPISRANYSLKSILSIYNHYYACINYKPEYKFEFKQKKYDIGISAGLTQTSLAFDGSITDPVFRHLVLTDFKEQIRPTAGIFLDIPLSGTRDNFYSYNEFLITSYRLKGTFNDYEHEEKYTINTTTFGYTSQKTSIMLRYYQHFNDFSVFVNVGAVSTLAIATANERIMEVKFYTDEYIKEELALKKPKRHELGVGAGMGIRHNKLSAEFRLEKGNGVSRSTGLTSLSSTLFFIAGYRF